MSLYRLLKSSRTALSVVRVFVAAFLVLACATVVVAVPLAQAEISHVLRLRYEILRR